MALTGHLSDLSLSEFIEFFCNQRKSGRLTVLYPQGPGYFYLQSGSVVDARIGVARGIDAVYYALTLPNAKFEFNAAAETSERTINQPWTQVVLEGLRRLDEGVKPQEAFPTGYQPEPVDSEKSQTEKVPGERRVPPAFLSFIDKETISKRKPLFAGVVAVAVLGSVAAVGVPAGWYSRKQVTAAATLPVTPAPAPEVSTTTPEQPAQPSVSETTPVSSSSEDPAALAAKRQRERDRAQREERAARANQSVTSPSSSSSASSVAESKGAKKVAVTVTYDETGRVVQASGGDPSAIRIARQKRFPPGKAGSATITIPIN